MATTTRPDRTRSLSAEALEDLRQLMHAADPQLPLDDIPLTDPRWEQDALCAQTDPEAFFPEKGGSTRDAKKVCNACDVRARCLAYALANDERFGIWGGLSERERRKIREPRKIKAGGTL